MITQTAPIFIQTRSAKTGGRRLLNVARIETLAEIGPNECHVHLIDWQGRLEVADGFNDLQQKIAVAISASLCASLVTGQ